MLDAHFLMFHNYNELQFQVFPMRAFTSRLQFETLIYLSLLNPKKSVKINELHLSAL